MLLNVSAAANPLSSARKPLTQEKAPLIALFRCLPHHPLPVLKASHPQILIFPLFVTDRARRPGCVVMTRKQHCVIRKLGQDLSKGMVHLVPVPARQIYATTTADEQCVA